MTLPKRVNEFRLRLRAVLGEWAVYVVVGLAVVALVGGWATYGAYAAPGTHVEEQTASSWQTSSTVSHRATVVNDTAVFAAGTTVENRSVYYTKIMPVLDGRYDVAYRGAEDGSLDAHVQATLSIRGVSSGDTQSTLWSVSVPLQSRNATGLAPGEHVTVPFSVNVTRVGNRVDRIQQQLGGGGSVETAVRVRTALSGTVDGRDVDRVVNRTVVVNANGGTYSVSGAGPASQQFERTVPVVVRNDPGPLRSIGGPLLFVVAVLGLAGFVVLRRRDAFEVSPADRSWLQYRDDRSEFEEWITTVHLPDDVFDGPEGEAATLADLVDYAIDADESVVEDPERKGFYVFHDGHRIAFYPPSPGDGVAPPL